MHDYISYIDYNSLRLGDIACEVGDYNIAVDYYSRALNRLRRYDGDRMGPAYMAKDLVDKIKKIREKRSNNFPVLEHKKWLLNLIKANHDHNPPCTST